MKLWLCGVGPAKLLYMHVSTCAMSFVSRCCIKVREIRNWSHYQQGHLKFLEKYRHKNHASERKITSSRIDSIRSLALCLELCVKCDGLDGRHRQAAYSIRLAARLHVHDYSCGLWVTRVSALFGTVENPMNSLWGTRLSSTQRRTKTHCSFLLTSIGSYPLAWRWGNSSDGGRFSA